MLLPVVAGSVVGLDGKLQAMREGKYIASCCRGQRRRFGWRVVSDEGQ